MIRHVLITGFLICTLGLSGCTTLFYESYKAVNHPLTLSQQLSDKTITSKANIVLMHYPGLVYVRDIHILVFKQHLLIVGEVPSRKIKRGLIKDLSRVAGVKQVYNYLTVGNSYTKAMSKEDILLKIKIEAALASHDDINTHHYYFVVYRQAVYLFGQSSMTNLNLTKQLVSRIVGVKKVLTFF